MADVKKSEFLKKQDEAKQGPSDEEIIASLDKPGAGLPSHHRLFLRWFVGPVISRAMPWERNRRSFRNMNERILKLVNRLSDDELSRRVLVPPVFGLEDSSRYWSVLMLLEHLVIVGSGIKAIVVSLSHGKVPDFEVEIAKVKPKGGKTPKEVVKSYTAFFRAVMDDIEREVKDKKSKAKLKHPWFGTFTAKQWHWLMAEHTIVHYDHLCAIIFEMFPREQAADILEPPRKKDA